MTKRKARHYQLSYQEANLDLVRIETTDEPDQSYFYQLNELGGVGACNCPHSLMRIFPKRRKLVEDLLRTNAAPMVAQQAKLIRHASGQCIHETMILEAEAQRAKIENQLVRRFGERPWRPKTGITLADLLRRTHQNLGIQTASAGESTWIDYAIGIYLDTLLANAPKQDGRPMDPPDWIWGNKTILERTQRLSQAIIEENLGKSHKAFAQALAALQGYLSQQAEAASLSGAQTPPAQLVEGFCQEIQPWLTPCQKAALAYIALRQDPPAELSIPFVERETLYRFGGKGRTFLELFA